MEEKIDQNQSSSSKTVEKPKNKNIIIVNHIQDNLMEKFNQQSDQQLADNNKNNENSFQKLTGNGNNGKANINFGSNLAQIFSGQNMNLNPLGQGMDLNRLQEMMGQTQQQQQIKWPVNNQQQHPPQYDQNTNYFSEFWQLYLRNEIIVQQMNEYQDEIKDLKNRLERVEEKLDYMDGNENSSQQLKLKKKQRRCAQEIDKNYVCPYQDCKKQYGSEVSLNLHIKIKHNGGNKTEREKLVRSIFLAQANGEKVPEHEINLPPGYIQEYKESMIKLQNSTKLTSKNDDNSQCQDDTQNQDSQLQQIQEAQALQQSMDVSNNKQEYINQMEQQDNQSNNQQDSNNQQIQQKNDDQNQTTEKKRSYSQQEEDLDENKNGQNQNSEENQQQKNLEYQSAEKKKEFEKNQQQLINSEIQQTVKKHTLASDQQKLMEQE
ncbi:hypothetical protein PPERSA_04553 [Pseudocohnilembus persalinus]|uniref:C2H2-type domain-containing protein n=1 Tax=Pseudocohnilembus persalinus TaxID=266149 RepID=A0A0V0QEB2_PSEPJ|nr:hypothetical protein PPERSA_04553 [Pseudocohnilembus persalinus]|eukprot:KRX00532.1 hypothetical protein PPERSA_04553 [Pseudocohnilembus persalinus]